jgi:hypothetical protein
MFNFRSAFTHIKTNPGAHAVIILVIVLFAGGLIVRGYNALRAKVPGGSALPAPKV